MALGCLTAGLVLLNMCFVITRIRKTDTQIEEAKNTNFLNALNNGVNMLYSGNFVTQRGGIEYLHNLAEENKTDQKQVKQVFEALRTFVKEIPGKDKEKICIEGEKFPTVVIKQEILYKITPPLITPLLEKCVYSKINTEINLRGAQLYGAYLQGNKVCLRGADLQRAELQKVDLQNANLQGADLRDANLQGADLRRAELRGANLEKANLQGADLRGATLQDVSLLQVAQLRGANLLGVKVIKANGSENIKHVENSLLSGERHDRRIDPSYALCDESCQAFWEAFMDKTKTDAVDAIWVREKWEKNQFDYEPVHSFSFKWRCKTIGNPLDKEQPIDKSELIKRLEERREEIHKDLNKSNKQILNECEIILHTISHITKEFPGEPSSFSS